MVMDGEFKVQDDETGETIETVGKGKILGKRVDEVYFSYRRERNAISVSNGTLYAIETDVLKKIIQDDPEDTLKERLGVLEKTHLFNSLLTTERETLAKSLYEVWFLENEEIIKEGEKGDKLFIIGEGKAEIWKTDVRNFHFFYLGCVSEM